MLRDVRLGANVQIHDFVNIYDSTIRSNTKISPFVEIGGATIGRNCKICTHSYICPGVTIHNNVFIGHNVSFTNDKYPRATNSHGKPQTSKDWKLERTVVENGVSIGSGATILCGITIGENAVIGAGSVVTEDVIKNTTVVGNPAHCIGGV